MVSKIAILRINRFIVLSNIIIKFEFALLLLKIFYKLLTSALLILLSNLIQEEFFIK